MYNILKKYRFSIVSGLLIVYCILLIVLTSLPGSSASKTSQIDKLYHIGAYGLLSFILYFFLLVQNKLQIFKKYPVTFTIFFATLFGILNELHQLFIPTRTFNKYDLLANLIGIVISVGIIKLLALFNKSFKNA